MVSVHDDIERTSDTIIACIREHSAEGDRVSLKLFRITGSPDLALAVWKNYATLEIREQIVDMPNTKTWDLTTARHMRETPEVFQIPARILPRPNKRKAPYA